MSDLAVFKLSFFIPTDYRINTIKTLVGYSLKHCKTNQIFVTLLTIIEHVVGLKCYNVLHFQIFFINKMAAVEGRKCPSVHTQVLDRFECAIEVLPVHCDLAHFPFFAQIALKKVSKYRSARFQTQQ